MTDAHPIGSFILAGGASTRMGGDKSLLELAGETLIARTLHLLERCRLQPTMVGPREKFAGLALGAPVVADDSPGLGPLGGIATALRHTRKSWNLILGCDLPFLTEDWIRYLIARATRAHKDAESRFDIVIPQNQGGLEPLCAMYHQRCVVAISAELDRGVRKVTAAFGGLRLDSILPEEWKAFDSGGLLFKNMNSPADYQRAREILEGKSKGQRPN
jgi:molybdopterin-guanine dinucleotide biosynthesis protein A